MNQPNQRTWSNRIIQAVKAPSLRTISLAILVALLVSALIVVLSNPEVHKTAGYFFARPTDILIAAWNAFASFFTSIFRGCIFDYTAPTLSAKFLPLTETLTRSVPLIIAGIAFTVAFKAGLFNIGVQGQLIFGAMVCALLGFGLSIPPILHSVVCVIGAILGGFIYGLLPGFIRAKLNANEVIVTIMLNSIAAYFLSYALQQKLFIGDGISGRSLPVLPSARFFVLPLVNARVHFGFIIALLATVFVWWLLERSTFGFQLRAAGANSAAAQTAGVNVKRVLLWTMAISGALGGLAATAPVLGTELFLSDGVAGSFGFDAIAVALLGKATPVGTLLAGILFGALNAGSSVMQASANIPVDIVHITQAVIVLMIAASDALRYYKNKNKKIAEKKVVSIQSQEVVK